LLCASAMVAARIARGRDTNLCLYDIHIARIFGSPFFLPGTRFWESIRRANARPFSGISQGIENSWLQSAFGHTCEPPGSLPRTFLFIGSAELSIP